MRSILPQNEEKAIKAAWSIVVWIDGCLNSGCKCDCNKPLDEAKLVLATLEQYKSELHDCDIKIAELGIENEKLKKIKKILDG
jgi:hypothetical protein